jgi:hypothetical protein
MQNSTLLRRAQHHGFSFQIARFIAVAMVTQKKYGAKGHAARGFTRANSRTVHPTANHIATISNSPKPIFFKPKNNGVQAALSSN